MVTKDYIPTINLKSEPHKNGQLYCVVVFFMSTTKTIIFDM